MRHLRPFTASVIVVAAAGLSACAPATINGTPSTSNAVHGGTATKAHIGSAVDLTGDTSGEKMSVKLIRIVQHGRGTEFSDPGHGHRFVGVQFRLTNIGKAAYSDSPSNGATVVDGKGQSYQAGFDTIAGCHAFGGTENIAPGGSGLGCVVFSVPEHDKVRLVQFGLDSGMASDTGQWRAVR
jgi:hypothetical protein